MTIDFHNRHASTAWEAILPAATHPNLVIWLWFKPSHAPLDLFVRVPLETMQAYGALSMRQLGALCGIEFKGVQFCMGPNGPMEVLGGANPALDVPLPPTAPWGEYGLRMWPPVMPATWSPPSPAPAASGDNRSVLMSIATDWTAIELAETQLGTLRKQLAAIQGRLTSLNRDLNADENIAADNQDKREWQDTRRWLRDGAAIASRYIKEADTGVTSMAGNRRRLEQLNADVVAGRVTGPQLSAAQNEIEAHRKTVQNILNQMQNALQGATRDGEQRATMVLTRIAAKVRNHRAKR